MKIRFLAVLSALLFISACSVTKTNKSTEIESNNYKELSSSESFRSAQSSISDTVVIHDTIIIRPETLTELEVSNLCDSLGNIRSGIRISTANANIETDTAGILRVKCRCEEQVNRITSEKKVLRIQNDSLISKSDSLQIEIESLKIQKEKSEKVKTSFKSILVSFSGWILFAVFFILWIKSKLF
ncbi:hypothetical protein [Croceimicrobium sp.]|uniref:hypothetical protein n=1 Tax=Croceimicrobium sp. TaxID=2828340 RepID=UPI003BA9B436